MARFSSSPWRVVKASRTRPYLLEIHNGHADPIAVIYSNRADAELMASSIRMWPLLKTLATARPEGQPFQVAREMARKLIAEVQS